jgi:hypothetical protein
MITRYEGEECSQAAHLAAVLVRYYAKLCPTCYILPKVLIFIVLYKKSMTLSTSSW